MSLKPQINVSADKQEHLLCLHVLRKPRDKLDDGTPDFGQ